MPQPFGSFPFDAAGVDPFAHPLTLTGNLRAPTTNDIYPAGTQWLDSSSSPGTMWETVGAGVWLAGGVPEATTTSFGSVQLATLSELQNGNAPAGAIVPLSNDVATVIAGIVVGAVPPATTAQQGIVYLASNAMVVPAYAGTLGPNTVVPVSAISTMHAAPGPIGSVTPSTGAFTTLGGSTVTFTAGGTWDSGGTAIGIGTDASTDAIDIGTAAAARTITLGNVSGATGVVINTGTAGFAVNTTGAGDISLNSDDTMLLDADGVLELNSSAGVISIGNDADNQNIGIGRGGTRAIIIGSGNGTTSVALEGGTGSSLSIGANLVAHTVLIGNVTGATAVNISVGSGGFSADGVTNSTYAIGASTTTGTITIGGTAQTGLTTLGSSSGTSTVAIQSGAGASTTTIGSGTAGANVTSINSGNTGANSTVNIMTGAMTAGTHAVNILSGNSSVGTETFNLATGTGAYAINIGTGITGVKTIAIGGTAANIITIANTQTGGSLTIGNALVGGTVTVGGATMTGALTLGASTAGQTVNISSASTIAGANVVNVLAGATPGASQTFNLMTGVGSAGTYAVNILTGNSTGTTQTVSIGTGSARTDVTIGGTGANVIAINNTTTAGTFSVGNAMTTGTISLGGASQTGLITIGKSTLGQTVGINNAASNTVANVVEILNGATPGANNTLNIMNGAGTAGTQTVNILAAGATRAGAVNIATGVAAHAVTIGQVTTTIAINGPTTHTLASGAATALTVTTAAGTGTAISATSSAVTIPDFLSNVGGIKVTPTDVAAAASPQVANNRFFKVVFNTVSIAAAADQALVITNSTITGVNTDIMITWSGTTTGSAVSLKSVVPAAGQVTLTFTNGTGATTTTSNITVIGWVLN